MRYKTELFSLNDLFRIEWLYATQVEALIFLPAVGIISKRRFNGGSVFIPPFLLHFKPRLGEFLETQINIGVNGEVGE